MSSVLLIITLVLWGIPALDSALIRERRLAEATKLLNCLYFDLVPY